MVYSKEQADRIRGFLAGRRGVEEKSMFGGVGFLLGGNMCAGVLGENMIVRVEPSETDALLREPGAMPFSLGGRGRMTGWVLVAPSGTRDKAALQKWLSRAVAYASSLPKKRVKAAKTKR